MSIQEFIAALWDQRRRILATAAVGGLLGGLLGVFGPQKFVAESSIAPESGDASLARLAGLAAQFGVPIGAEGGGNSVDFLSRLLASRELLSRLATATYSVPSGDTMRTATYLEIADIAGADSLERLLNAVEALRRTVLPSVDLTAGIVSIETRAGSRELAEGLNRRALEELNGISVMSQQRQASAEREFLEGRLKEAGDQLRIAEDAMKEFLATNRTYASSPELAFEATRLQRRLEIQQQLFLTLTQGLEQARLTEAKNTPILTIIDSPEGSAVRRNLPVLYAALFILLGALAASFFAVAPELRAWLSELVGFIEQH